MKLLSINFIGVNTLWGGVDSNINSASDVLQSLHTGVSTRTDADLHSIPNEENKLAPVAEIIKNSLSTAKPTGQIQLPKYEESDLEKAYRFGVPNLNNDDYYPEKTVNPIIGTASNKTLGTFPLFSSAVLAPAGIWDKRRKAIGDYMLELEKAKMSGKDPGLNYEYTPTEGSASWMKVFNDNAIEDLHSIEQEGAQVGISMKDAGKLGHPYNNAVNKTINEVKSGLKTVTDIDKTIADMSAKNLNLDNNIGKRASAAIELYKYLSSLPETSPIEFNGVTYQGKKGLARSQGFKDAMDELNRDLTVDNDLLSLADNRAKQIEKNSIEEARIAGYGDNYIQFTKDKIATKYPVTEANKLPSTEQYLDIIANQTARSRPSLFKETSAHPEEAPYTLDDLKEIFASNLGIERIHTESIAGIPGAGSTTATVNAAPQYVKGVLEKLSRGEVVQGKSGKSNITSGNVYTTYITNGQLKLVPNGNVVENAKAIAEAGGADNEYGSVDAPTAIVQMETGKDADNIYTEFKNARPTTGGRLVIKPTDSQQQRFNQSLESFAGKNGAPIAGGDDIWISRMQSMNDAKDDSRFYFELRDKSSKIKANGVLIPKDRVMPSVENPNATGWSHFWGNDQENVFVPKGQDAMILEGAYYHYNPATKDDIASYSIYDKKTHSPYMFPGKNQFDPKYEVKLPEYYVKNILAQPENLVKQANESYKTDKQSPTSTQMTSVTDTKTKTGGKGTTMTVEDKPVQLSESRLKVVKNIMSKYKYSYEDAVKYENAYATSTKADEKDAYAKMLKDSQKVDVSDIKGGRQTQSTGNSDDAWIGKIMDFEKVKGGYNSQTGKSYGLSNYGYNSRNPSSKEEAIKFFKEDYLPKVKEYPKDLQPRLADYIYNTGRNPKDLLLYAAGYISLDDINSSKSFDKLYEEKKSDIDKKMKSKDFKDLLDNAKINVYQTTHGYKLESPNPAYDATWHDRIRIFDK